MLDAPPNCLIIGGRDVTETANGLRPKPTPHEYIGVGYWASVQQRKPVE